MTHESTSATLRMRCLRALLFACAAASPALAWAHPGHDGGFLQAALHPFHGLDHVLAAVAVGVWGARLGGKAAWALPLAFVAALLGGAALGIVGWGLPLSEVAIAFSVAALGLMVALDGRATPACAAALMALFALFHGSAHGLEATTSAHWGSYAAGIALGTLSLHAAGVGATIALRARPLVLRLAAVPMAFAGLAMLANRLQ